MTSLILPNHHANPLQQLLVSILRGQFPNLKPEAQIIRAEALAATITTALKKHNFAVLNDGRDLINIERRLTFTDAQLAGINAPSPEARRDLLYRYELGQLMEMAAQIIATEQLYQLEEPPPEPASTVHKAVARMTIFAPGYGMRKDMAEREAAITAGQAGSA